MSTDSTVARHPAQHDQHEEVLLDTLSAFALSALHANYALLVIATPAHRDTLDDRLHLCGLDLAALRERGQYITLDAGEQLANILLDGWPDQRLFEQSVSGVVATAANEFGHVHAFSEMLALLCRGEKYSAAIRLEGLWEELAAQQPLSVLRAYPTALIDDAEGDDHSAVGTELRVRRALERRLALLEHELADFLENAVEPLHKVDPDGILLWANKAELALLGFAPDEYIGHHFSEFHVDSIAAAGLLQRLFAGETLRDLPARLRCKSGALKDVLISSNTYWAGGKPLYTRCFTRDVTTSKLSTHALHDEIGIWNVLRRTGTALANQLDSSRLIQTATDAAVELTGAAFGAFFYNVENSEGETYMLYALSGAPSSAFADFPMPRNTALFGTTFRGEGIVRCDDLHTDQRYGKSAPYHGTPPGHLPVRSYLAVPVISHSRHVHGGLFFGHPEIGVFTSRDELIVAGIAAQAATALDNAQLFQANERAREELSEWNNTLETRISEGTEALRRSEQLLHQLLSGIADYAIFLLDVDGNVVTWNTGAERIKGYTTEEIVGRHFSCFYTPEDRDADVPGQAMAIARAHGKYEAEASRVRKDGSRFFANVLLQAIHDESGEIVGFAKVTRDMTERKAMEEQLHQSQKIEAIGRLTGGVAHDFNNLLTIIIGNLDIIGRQARDDATVRRAAEQALRGAQRAATLTQQLLAFSRRQPLNPKPTDINRLVASMSDLLRRALGESIAIETVLAGGLWRTEVDASQFESALLNLAVNARDAMPEGGKLTIETANSHLDEMYRRDYAELSASQYVVVCVTDTGTGMPHDVRDQAFEPFFTTKPVGQGTGLGLSQVYGFVKQSGGHTKIYSEPGEGTTVKLYLRRLHGDAPDNASRTVEEVAIGGTETILLVEDEEGVRLYSSDALRELGFRVIEAGDGPSALQALEQHPEITLLFTDVGLPGFNGRQLAEQARQRRPDLKVLFTTGYARNAIVHQGRLDEGVELLTKPYTRAQLASRIRDMLDLPQPSDSPSVALLVEDEPLLRRLFAQTLQDFGFVVIEADSAAAAFAAIRDNGDFALALIDIGLGDRSGLEVAASLRAASPRLPIVLTSGLGDYMTGNALLDGDRHTATLTKPFELKTLAAKLISLGVKIRQ